MYQRVVIPSDGRPGVTLQAETVEELNCLVEDYLKRRDDKQNPQGEKVGNAMKTGTFFEINVSQKGRHVFATDSMIRSYTDAHIVELLRLFAEKFPTSEGYEFSVTCWHCGAGSMPESVEVAIPKRETVKKELSDESSGVSCLEAEGAGGEREVSGEGT